MLVSSSSRHNPKDDEEPCPRVPRVERSERNKEPGRRNVLPFNGQSYPVDVRHSLVKKAQWPMMRPNALKGNDKIRLMKLFSCILTKALPADGWTDGRTDERMDQRTDRPTG